MRVYTPRTRRQRRSDTIARVVEAITGMIASVAFALMIAWVGLNWLSGCGEQFPTANGGYIAGECVLMPWRD